MRSKRYVLVRNPRQAEKDRATRQKLLAQLHDELDHLRHAYPDSHPKGACRLLSHPTYGRYLRVDKKGRLHLDQAKVKEEAQLDGEYLLETSDDTLSAEDVALGYKQLFEVEEAFRTLKQTLEPRPVYHRLEERIRTHVVLCWLGLMLVRIMEQKSGDTWRNLRRELGMMHLVENAGPDGRVLQRTETTSAQKQIFTRLGLSEPPLVLEVTPAVL